MLPPVNGQTQGYLDELDRIQSVLTNVSRQVSSGVRVGVASDDPAAVPVIYRAQSAIAMNQQVQTNLNQTKTELDSGDAALQQAIKLMDQATSLGSQAGAGKPSDSEFKTLLQQAQSIQQAMVAIASTNVNGRYIFSGDTDTQPLYTLDASQANGVRLTGPATSTIAITDAGGNTVWQPKTATEIFDSSDPASNVFAALGSLISAFQNKDGVAAQAAASGIKTAEEHLNQQLGLYGIGENRVADALSAAISSQTTEKQQLGAARDTDVAAAAIQLSQANLEQQSAMSVGARISQQKNLFDFLA